ncbi:MAG: histidine kinase [Ideonella sp.]|nr:histidine kinase [Ideonella sp.]MCC7455418.1 histidine kinase [Nitrospira sp.]
MTTHTPPAASTTGPPETRPASLWPQTTRPGAPGATQAFEPTSFDSSSIEDPAAVRARQLQRVSELYDLCQPTLVLRVVLLVQAGVAVATLAAAGGALAWLNQMAELAFPVLAGTLLWLTAVCLLKRLWARVAAWQRAACAIALGAVAAIGGWSLLLPLGMATPQPWTLLASALSGASFAALVWAWLDRRARSAKPADASARLAELQSRIRPHFLFNALNTAVALVQIDPERAEAVLEDLAQLFRVALAEVGASVTLAEEIDLAKRYLAIEQIRFGERLAVSWEVDPATGEARVPPLVLQPLVENAVRHGIETALRGGTVRVRAKMRHGSAQVLISNSLPDTPAAPGTGIALANVRERLALLHDFGASLETWTADEQFHARVTVPV